MSWDAYLEVDAGGSERAQIVGLDRNYTYNVGPMIVEAMGRRLGELDGIRAGDAEKEISAAILNLEADPAKYQAMNPSNGWGDYEGCVEFLKDIAVACRAHPNAFLKVY